MIPAYNAEKWIAETIRSAVNQTWINKEIIIVDDGSTDSTLHIAKQFESKSLTVITQNNRGASAARNKALSYAQGDYLQWLDADDLLAPDKISQQLKKVDIDQDPSILYSSACGLFYFRHQNAEFVPNVLWMDLLPVEWLILKFSNFGKNWISNSAWLVSRELTEKSGPWDERLSFDDDGEYFCRIISKCDKIKFVPNAKSYYRRDNFSSLSQTRSIEALTSLILSTELCIKYLLSIEDNATTRAACLKLLQNHYFKVYPNKLELIDRIRIQARNLGGTISQPDEEWKFAFVRRMIGWENAILLKKITRKAYLSIRKNLDKLFYLLYNK